MRHLGAILFFPDAMAHGREKADMERKRGIRYRAEQQRRIEKLQYEVNRSAWEMKCHTIEEEWQPQRDAAKGAKTRIPKSHNSLLNRNDPSKHVCQLMRRLLDRMKIIVMNPSRMIWRKK